MTKLLTKIEDWKGKNVSIHPLSGGLTNTNFKVEVDGVPYFVRVPGESTELLAIDRNNEYHNTKAAAEAGVGPKVLYHLPEYNVMVMEFLQRQNHVEGFLERTRNADAHGAGDQKTECRRPRFFSDFNMFRLTEYYLSLCKERSIRIPDGYPGKNVNG